MRLNSTWHMTEPCTMVPFLTARAASKLSTTICHCLLVDLALLEGQGANLRACLEARACCMVRGCDQTGCPAVTWLHAACRWVWLGVGVLIFANLLFLTITILAHQFLNSFEGSNTTVSEDMLNERAFAAKGHTDPNAGPEVAIDVQVSSNVHEQL